MNAIMIYLLTYAVITIPAERSYLDLFLNWLIIFTILSVIFFVLLWTYRFIKGRRNF